MIQLVMLSDRIGMMHAAIIHSESWKASHKNICSAEFLAIHTPERQRDYLESQIEKGAQLYMLLNEKPVGIVTVRGNLIENLYVLPREQNKEYGTRLLAFAMENAWNLLFCGCLAPTTERSASMNAMVFSLQETLCITRTACMKRNFV